MQEQDILLEKKGHVGIIILNRPDKRNALTGKSMDILLDSLKKFEKDDDIYVVIIRGNGKGFCCGHDLDEMLGKKTALEYRKVLQGSEPIARTITSMYKPVIAAVHGIAVAGGCALAAACDLVVASEDARFGLTGIRVGLACIPPAAVVSQSVGKKKSLELLLTERVIDASEAERIGLVNRVVPREKLEESALELANEIASLSPTAVQLAKHAFHTFTDMEYLKAVSYASEMIAINAESDDVRNGIAHFLRRQQPKEEAIKAK